MITKLRGNGLSADVQFWGDEMSAHDRLTWLLVWLWERGHPIMDAEAQELVTEDDHVWVVRK